MFNYVCTVKSNSTDGFYEIIGSTDKELNSTSLLELLLSDISFVAVQDENAELGFYKHQYYKFCTSKIGHAF